MSHSLFRRRLATLPLVCGVLGVSGCAGLMKSSPTQAAAPAPTRSREFDAALKQEREGQLEAARRTYETALRSHPQDPRALHRLAVVCTRLGDHAAANGYYDRAIKAAPYNADLITDAGYSKCLQQDYAAAETLLRRAVALAPQNQRAVNNLALVVGLRGRTAESLALYQRVNPPAEALCHLANVHQQRNEPQLALECYQAARSADPRVEIPQSLLVADDARARRQTSEAPTAADVAVAEAVAVDPFEFDAAAAPAAESVSPTGLQLPEADLPWAEASPVDQVAAAPETAARHPLLDDDAAAPWQQEAAVAPPATQASAAPLPDPSQRPDADVAEAAAAFPAAEDRAPEVAFEPAAESSPIDWREEQLRILRQRGETEGLKGFCPVSLRDEQRLIDARSTYTAEYRSQVYQFGSAEAVQRFQADPERYVPAAGGLDVVAVRRAQAVSAGSLDYSLWYRNRLFLFANAENRNEFRAAPAQFVEAR